MPVLEDIVARLVADEYRRTEADIQSSVRELLLHGDFDLGDHHVRLESPAPNRRRIDVEVGATVIEVKRDLTRGLEAAEDQLAGYLRDREREFGSRYVGVLTDGRSWRAYRLRGDAVITVATHNLPAERPDGVALALWLDGLLATRQHIAPTQSEVQLRLGADSSATRLELSELRWVYEQGASDPALQLKRELWARLLRTAFGTAFDADDTTLFIEHTYLVVLAELIAHAALGFDLEQAALDPDELLAGTAFSRADILGVVESDFFDWPVEVGEDGRAWVNNLARRIARFEWSHVEHDVLKVLYESVIGAETRHSLGEYYTPDWLARAIVSGVVDDPETQSVLDPGCGSGTFLFWAVRAALEACEAAGMTSSEAITSISGRIFGFDIHPVAVALARVTYLLAIGPERLRADRPKFSVPVYLGDAVQYQRRQDLHDADALVLYTSDGASLFETELRFPERVVDNIRWFDALVGEMTSRAADRQPGSAVPNMRAAYDRYGVAPEDREMLDQTMATLCELCDMGRNHIWGYYVRNEARPRWLSRPERAVDRLVGNPPWLSFRYMTESMQERFRELSEGRDLWEGARVATHQDLSALFVVRSVELYLREGGRFGFLMPLAVLTREAYTGFRAAEWGSVTADFDAPPWDLHDILPRIFPVPPAAVFGTKTRELHRMRSPVQHWRGRQPSGSEVGETLTVEPVALIEMPTEVSDWSEYRGRFRQGATIVPRSLAMVEPDEQNPLGPSAGTRHVQGRRGARDREPWKSLPPMRGTIEERFVFGMHHGPTVYPFRTTSPDDIVLPWVAGELLEADSSELDRWPGVQAWWQEASARWGQHRGDRSPQTLADRINYHHGLSNQARALTDLRVVYTKGGQYVAAALVEDPEAIIDHKLYWCAVYAKEEARYLTAVLNAPVVTERVIPLQARGEHNPRDIDKYVWALPIPRFDPSDDLHKQLVDAAEEGEQVAAAVEIGDTRFETGRRRIREALVESGVAGRLNDMVDELLMRATAEAENP